MNQERKPDWITLPGQWLVVFRCKKTPQHLLYVAEELSGVVEGAEADPIWCPWGSENHESPMDRLPGEFEVVVTGAMRGPVRTGANP